MALKMDQVIFAEVIINAKNLSIRCIGAYESLFSEIYIMLSPDLNSFFDSFFWISDGFFSDWLADCISLADLTSSLIFDCLYEVICTTSSSLSAERILFLTLHPQLNILVVCLNEMIIENSHSITVAQFIPTPSREKWLQIADDMWTMCNFPNCWETLVAMGMENWTLNIPESPLPSRVNIVAPNEILGDEPFFFKTYMIRHYPGSNAQDYERRISIFRSRWERRFVVCAGSSLQIFQSVEKKTESYSKNAISFILTTCIMDNIIRNTKAINIEGKPDPSHNMNNNRQNLRRQEGNAQRDVFETREICKKYFNSIQVSISWQRNIVAQ